jgi:hypothetical protein
MLNFYKFYNKVGLDKEEYGQLIEMLHINEYTSQITPIEHIIKRECPFAYRYARDVIKGRWYEVEPYIQRSPLWWSEYKRYHNIVEYK